MDEYERAEFFRQAFRNMYYGSGGTVSCLTIEQAGKLLETIKSDETAKKKGDEDGI